MLLADTISFNYTLNHMENPQVKQLKATPPFRRGNAFRQL